VESEIGKSFQLPVVPCIVGPTCSGKTSLSILLADKINAEIISADSRQIYRYLNIGTAKPVDEILKKVKHHFINILEPDQAYNVSRFESDALQTIENIFMQKKVPIVAGGSGLYIRAITDGIFDAVDTDEEFRNYLLQKKKQFGNEYLYKQLQTVDPDGAANMLPQNWKRVIRALEVFHLTGKSIKLLQSIHKRQNKFSVIQFGLEWDRKLLYQNIENRVDEMIASGLIDEVKFLLVRYDKNLNSLNTVGYKEIISYLENEITLDRAIELIKRNTRRYAKRQLTWFRADSRIKWFQIHSMDDLESISDKIFKLLPEYRFN